jgi:hypothetical protein
MTLGPSDKEATHKARGPEFDPLWTAQVCENHVTFDAGPRGLAGQLLPGFLNCYF